MTTIWKFPIEIKDEVIVSMPKGAQVLSVQMQGALPCIWAIVDPARETEQRAFRVFGTGHPLPSAQAATMKFIGTIQIGWMVFHVFEN